MLKIVFQILGILVLLILVTIVTKRIQYSDHDGPSILFPGGALVSGKLHSGPEPDWSFTEEVFTIELETSKPLSSRRIFIVEVDGRIFVPSGYMKSFLGKLWKDWAFNAEQGDDQAVMRIADTRYERNLVRVTDPVITDQVAAKIAAKYAGGASPEVVSEAKRSIDEAETWIFELAPRGATAGAGQ